MSPDPARHPGEGRGLNGALGRDGEIPAFAGMTSMAVWKLSRRSLKRLQRFARYHPARLGGFLRSDDFDAPLGPFAHRQALIFACRALRIAPRAIDDGQNDLIFRKTENGRAS